VDLERDEIVMHRQPANDRYDWIMAKARGETVALDVLPELVVGVDEILGEPS
jgi:hypothetical protein